MSRMMVAGVVLLSLVALAGVVQAATLFTPPIQPVGDNEFDCWIVNVSGTAKTVQIRVLNSSGSVLSNSGPVTLNAGVVTVRTVFSEQNPRYCRFDVQGGKNSYRAGAAIFQAGVGHIATSPAQ